MTGPEDGLVYSVDGAVVMRVGAAWYGRAADGEVVDFYASARDCVRPLVVIDPEDRESAGRLLNLLWQMGGWGVGGSLDELTDNFQAALREFANPTPPKPFVTAEMVEAIRNQVKADRETPYWRDRDHLDAVHAWVESLADHLGVTE